MLRHNQLNVENLGKNDFLKGFHVWYSLSKNIEFYKSEVLV